MARQKKESPNSILRRAVDRTPLRSATLRNFGPGSTTSPARFAARYFERNSGLIQRYLNLGGENSPLHRPIGLNIVTRFTEFNQSFGPVQRALRPQPEHAKRRPQVEENAEFADSYAEEADSFAYALEPAYFNEPQPQTSYNQPTNQEYGAARPVSVPWETSLNATPLPIARRIDFQPANLRYINSPERQTQRTNRPAQAQVARSVPPAEPLTVPPVTGVQNTTPQTVVGPTPVSQAMTGQPVAQVAPVNFPQSAEAVERVALPQPANETTATAAPSNVRPSSPTVPASPTAPSDFAAPVQAAPSLSADFIPSTDYATPAIPTQGAEPGLVVARTAVEPDYATPVYPDNNESGYAVEPSPIYRPIAQPALSRAIQRAAEMSGSQPNTAGTLGAGPAAIARRYISPVTMARYRALQQTTDKILRGEQPSIEPVSQVNPFAPARPGEAARLFEPRYVPQRQLNPAVARRNAQKAQEAQRIQEESGTFLTTQETDAEVRQESTVQPFSPETRQQVQFNKAQGVESTTSRFVDQPAEVQRPDSAKAVPAQVSGLDQPSTQEARPSVEGSTARPTEPAVARFVDQPVAQSGDAQGVTSPTEQPSVRSAAGPTGIQQPGSAPMVPAQETVFEAAQEVRPVIERPTEPAVTRFVQPPTERPSSQPTQTPAEFEAIEVPAVVARVQPTGPVARGQETPALEPAYQASEAVVRRAIPTNEISDYGYDEAVEASDPFEDAIPASLLENNAFSGEVIPEVQRLTGNRLRTQLRTTQWANTLPTLRNNPGIAAGPARIARQLEDAAAPEIDNWRAGSGAGVYIAQNWLRRKHSADSAAAETQDRIFSLAETTGSVADFQPQLMRAMAFEEVAVPLVSNRVQPSSPVTSPFNPTYVPQQAPGRPGSITPAPASGVSRTVEPASTNTEFAVAPDQPITGRSLVTPVENQPYNAAPVSPAKSPFNPAAPAPRVEGQAAPFIQRISPDGQPVSAEQVFAAEESFESPAQTAPLGTRPGLTPQALTPVASVEGQPYFAGDVPQAFTADGQPVDYGQPAAPGKQYRAIQRIIQARGLQPTALQRVFKRMDMDAPAMGNVAESAGLGFGNMPLSYVAQPGLRRNRVKPLDLDAAAEQSYFEDSFSESGPVDYAAQPSPQVAPVIPVARVYREQADVRPTARTYNAPEILPGQIPAPTINALPGAPVNPAQTTSIENGAARLVSPAPIAASPVQAAAQSDFEGAEASPVAPDSEVTAIQRVPTAPGQPVVPSQPQYFRNSLEASWLTPENRLIIERLPGGSSALQRLFQAPRSSFEPRLFAAALDLPTLRNNPGLASQVARVLDESGVFNASGGWPSSFPLSYVPQRRTGRPAQVARSVEGDDAALPVDFGDFEGAMLSPNETLPGSVVQPQAGPIQRAFVAQPERIRQTAQAAQSGLNTQPSTQTSVEPGIVQAGMNRETATRIQRNLAGKIESTRQENPATSPAALAISSFTVSGDWMAQLQRHYQGLSTGQLNGPTSLVMRLMTEDGKAKSSLATFAGYEAVNNFGNKPNLNYITPPLLLQKVSKNAPEDGMAAYNQMAAGPTPFQGPGYTSPGEVLRAFDRADPIYSRAEEKLAPFERTAESVAAAELTLPRLRQTNNTLQRINGLETTNNVLELAHHVDEAALAAAVEAPLPFNQPASYFPLPFNLPRSAETNGARRVTESVARMVEAETAVAPLRMADAPVKRPGEPRFLEVDAEVLEDAAEVRPEPIVVRVPEKPVYRTPLEAATARHSADGPNIGQGQILQPLAIQRKAAPTPSQPAHFAPLVQPTLHSVIKSSVGRSLEHVVQRKMSNMFKSKFHDVKVHTGDEAAQATKHVGAEAFTLGSNIYFAPGRYQPETQAGQALIGHELTHVVQQSSLPSLGNGRIPETSGHGQTLEHHAIANEQLILRHLASPAPRHDDHDHDHNGHDHDHNTGLSAGIDGRLSFSPINSSQPGGTATATIERSYQPMADYPNHKPVNLSHLRPSVQRAGPINTDIYGNKQDADGIHMSGPLHYDDAVKLIRRMILESADVEERDEMARMIYQLIRDELMIERERGFGPSNKFF